MEGYEIKFEFDSSYLDKYQLDAIFDKIGNRLNIRFDENLRPYSTDDDKIYIMEDVSGESGENIRLIKDSFFDFTFENIVDVSLYRFLVLKNNDKLTVLANIHSSIFDYSSINAFHDLFNGFDENPLKNAVLPYYDYVDNYLNSSDFEKDLAYWNNCLSDIGNYVRYYNIESDSYGKIKIPLENESVSNFLNDYDVSKFRFILALFSLYLSRIDRTGGCLLKTIKPSNENQIGPFDKNILLNIKYDGEKSFTDYLNDVGCVFDSLEEHTKVDIDYYINENLTGYYIHDFTGFEDIHVLNGKNSALTLNLFDDYIELIYNTDLFLDVYIEHMAANIQSLIDNIISSPNKLCREIDILSDDEKQLISKFCKGKRKEYDKDKTLAYMFRENAKNNPEKLAIDDGINKITYGELEKSTNSIAHDLHDNYGIDFGFPVGLMLKRNYHFPEMVLALNKIGATVIPIDTQYPAKRIEQMINVSQARHIITTKEMAQDLDLDINKICIEDLKYDLDVEVEINGGADDLFAIMFTSGTTGLPKGVMVPNKQLCGMANVHTHIIFSQGDCDTIGCYSSFSFVGVYWIFWALYFGNSTRIFNEQEREDFLLFIKALEDCPLHFIILPAVLIKPILENENIQIDYLISAGSKMNQLASIKTNKTLCNAYGSTEIKATAHVCNLKEGDFSIGKPLDNTWIYILDENSMEVPVGVAGEICISTDNLSLGYINNPEMTRQRYVDNPYADCEDNKILYHTGDVGYYNFDGNIEIIGRNDDQLSVRGFRIESDEILRIMNGYDAISQVCLDVDNENLTAYYTTNDDVDIENVREALKSELPGYMIPSLFVELDSIPLNVNGKIDKFALKSISRETSSSHIDDEILKSVLDSFKKVLNTPSVFLDDDFVSLGGNSLVAMKLQLEMKEKLDVSLSSNQIIELSTPSNIGNFIKFNLNHHIAGEEINYAFDGGCPLSGSQLNIFLDEMVKDVGTAYNNSFMIKFKKEYSSDEFKKAISKLIEVYPIFKSRVVVDEGDLPKCVFDAEIEITEGFLSDIDSFVRPFELDKCLSRFLIVEDDSSNYLCCDFHHLIFDGTSLNIFLEQLNSILNGNETEFVDNGILRQVSFEETISQDYINDAEDFLHGMLASRDEVHDLLPSLDGEESIYTDTFDIDDEHLTSFLKSHLITHNQFFASVFGYALSKFACSTKVLFNIVEDGRGHIDLSDSVGMYAKNLPVLMDCANQDVSSFLEYSSSLINSLMKYDGYPFHHLVNDFDLNSNIVFQYAPDLFYNEFCDKFDYKIEGLTHDAFGDIVFYIFNIDINKMGIKIFHSSRFSDEFVKQFADSFKLILKEMFSVRNLSEISYIKESDLEILDDINHTEHAIGYEDILDAFNDNLSKYPNSKLVSYNDVSYSYAEGAYIADKIAKRLVELGVCPQDNVGFLVERSQLYMFCILAIMSMGGVYVPLDDNLPDERLKFMVKDTGSDVILASDETYERALNLYPNNRIVNISDISSERGILNHLDVVGGELACILYTSGSTGLPKGVEVTRKSSLNISAYYADTYNLSNHDVFGMYASIGFDAGSHAILSTIYAGAALSVVPSDIRLNVFKLNEYYMNQGVTQTFITTQVGKLFMQSIEKTSLNVLVVGGEKLGEFESPENYDLIDIYGPTEAFVFVASCNNSDKMDYSSVGNLVYNTKAYILDEELRRIPVGAIGELYLAGHQISRGYINNVEKNIESFVDNPFDGSDDYNVMYRTGDMAKVLRDGSFAIMGRRDNQVKIRGNRVELSELEVIIREIDYVDDVTVQTVKNGFNNELVVYVVPSRPVINLKESVQDYVSSKKPQYMVPSHVISLDKIPLNINGKVDRKRLPQINIESDRDYEAPQSYFEHAIANGFSEVLGISRPIGRNEEFSSLGGDSISVMMLIVKLRESNININVKDVLDNQSVKRIAENAQFKLSINKVSQDAFEGFVDTTPIVQHFFDSNFKNPSYFNQALFFESSQKIDENILKKAMLTVLNHHDLLRAKVKDEKLFVRPINDEEYFTIEKCDSTDYRSESIRINSEINIFDGPLIKLAIFCENGVDYLLIVIHHLLVDGVSWRIIVEDLNLAYAQLLNNKEIKLPNKTSSYQDYALAINRYRSDEELLKEKPYWTDTLDSMMKIKHTEINSDIRKREKLLLRFSKDKSSLLLNNAPKNYNSSINGIFLSAVLKAWNSVMGDDKLSVRMEGHGRHDFDEDILIDRTVGWFTNCYPVVLESGCSEITQIIDDVSEILDRIPQDGFGYPPLMGIETKELPLFTFNYLGEMNKLKTGEMFVAKYNPHMEEIIAVENNYGTDIAMNGYSLSRETHFNLEYDCERFTREDMRDFANEFLKTLDEIATSCDENDYKDDIKIFSNHPDKKNLFFIHSANYGSEFFYYIAEQLKDDYSFSVIEPYNINHKENPLTSIDEFASKYIKIIKSIQPEGPYYIGGLCFGGAIALEIAQQLKQQNEKVEKLIIFDAHYIEDEQLQELVIQDQILYARKYQKEGALTPKDEDMEYMVFHANLSVKIWLSYKLKFYDGETIYFRGNRRPEGELSETAAKLFDYVFSKKAGGFEDYFDEDKFSVVGVPAEHNNMFSTEALKIIVPEIKKFTGD
ncbi:condensation domain-containing protein [Methanobrevibacter sp.]|uniref:condensation domain-containing protein n=1 Tax=Methanobrevibacter sp. TaxID=66852 RepID=UPI0025EC3994|nr:condensation domain-containing protein [Methanobrevibacter sp.]MBQ6512602.1 AMP-binding protein [Methanobrevibacter sp.]